MVALAREPTMWQGADERIRMRYACRSRAVLSGFLGDGWLRSHRLRALRRLGDDGREVGRRAEKRSRAYLGPFAHGAWRRPLCGVLVKATVLSMSLTRVGLRIEGLTHHAAQRLSFVVSLLSGKL